MTLLKNALMPVVALALLAGCNKKTGSASTEFQKSATGLEYKIFPAKVAEGDSVKKPKKGDIMSFHIAYYNSKDSLLLTTFDKKTPFLMPLLPSTFKGSLEDGLMMLSPGDSGVFKVNADSFFVHSIRQPLPHFIAKGSDLRFHVKMLKIMNEKEAQAEQQRLYEEQQRDMMAHAEVQGKKDDSVLQNYIKAKALKAERAPSGLYYIINQAGKGANPKPGQTVKVHYTGTTLDGHKFDSSVDRGTPFEFVLGQGQVIQGWDEGIALLNKGSKATLLIPSTMAYGERGAGKDIPANAPLRFEVELIDFK